MAITLVRQKTIFGTVRCTGSQRRRWNFSSQGPSPEGIALLALERNEAQTSCPNQTPHVRECFIRARTRVLASLLVAIVTSS